MLLTDLVNSLANKQSAENPAEGQLTTRLFDYWKELRGNCAFPSRELIRFEDVPELSEYGFTLSVGEDGSDPTFYFVGSALREHIGGDLGDKIPLGNSDSTLLSLSLGLTTRRYVEALQRKAPVGFESEVVDHGGTNSLFRIIMLPFSEDNRKIDFILGAITYKEKLSQTVLASPSEDARTTGSRRPPTAIQEVSRSVTMDDRGVDLATPAEGDLTNSLRECQGPASIVHASESRPRGRRNEEIRTMAKAKAKTKAKAKAKTGNPFLDADLGNILDFSKFAEQFMLPGVVTKALMESQRRNVEAVTKANQIAFEGAQAVMQRQVEILRDTLDGTTKAVQTLSTTGKPEDIWAQQAEFLKEAYEHGLANLRDLTELSTKANSEAADLLTHRVADGLGELKGAFKATNGGAEKAAH